MKSWISVFALVSLLAACDDDPADSESGIEAFGDLAVHTDLLARVHLVDVDHKGLFIDLGGACGLVVDLGDPVLRFGLRGRVV